MSDDLTRKQGGAPAHARLSSDDIITLALQAVEAWRDDVRRTEQDPSSDPQRQAGVQRPGLTVALGGYKIVSLPDKLIGKIKDEIERLAINHNEISSFPARLVECRRLRYLNARTNLFTEIPRTVLQLASLEILDLSRNKLRTVPDEIRNLSSLKVLSLERNRIERLPISLGDMNTLRVLKVEDNPLVFPPIDLCISDDRQARGGQKYVHSTTRIKEFLRRYAGHHSRRWHSQAETDVDFSESNAETPRPYRPFGPAGRFPVKPSMGGMDSMLMPSTSPDPPPIPVRNHERMRSIQQMQARKPSLLSPPDLNGVAYTDAGGDVTIRPKRHGIITPRGPEGVAQASAFSPSALQEAFSNYGSRPASRAGSNTSLSMPPDQVGDISRLVFAMTGDLSKQLNNLRPLIEYHAQADLKTQAELELRTASRRYDILSRCLRRSQAGQTKQSFLMRPALDCLASISHLARIMSQASMMVSRTQPHESIRTSFWMLHKDTWEVYLTNSKTMEAVKSATHSRQTSASSFRNHAYADSRGPMTSIFDPRFQHRSGQNSSPTNSHFPGISLPTPNLSFSSTFSPLQPVTSTFARPMPILAPDGSYIMRDEDLRQEIANDAIWESVIGSLRNLCDRANEGLPKIQSHYYAEYDKARHLHDQESEIMRQLSSLVTRSSNMIEITTALTKKIENMRPNDRTVRHSLEFWQLCRNIILEWTGYIDRTRSLRDIPSTINAEIKPVMKSIHGILKETSQRLSASPWGHYLDSSNFVGPGGRPFPTHTASSSVASTVGMSQSGTLMGPPPLPREQQGPPQRLQQHQHQHSAGSVSGTMSGSTASLGPPAEIPRRGGSDGSNGSNGRNGAPPPTNGGVGGAVSNGAGAIAPVDGNGNGDASVPSTPLGAALGPAAAAAALGKPGAGRAAINFFERVDRLERMERSASQPRQPELLYTKKSIG